MMKEEVPLPERLWDPTETARFLGVPVSTLYYWSYRGEGGPAVLRVGRRLRYDPHEVRRWLQTRAA